MRVSTILKLALVGALGLILALVIVVRSIDINQYRGLLAQAAKSATGRDMAINGKLSLKLSLTPALIAEDITFANAPWGSRPEMLKLRRIRADIGLLPLLLREIRLKRLVLIGPDIVLERNAKGQANWDFGLKPGAAGVPSAEASGTQTSFKIGQVRIEDGRILYKDGRTGQQQTVQIDRLTADADGLSAPIGLQAKGSWNARQAEISGVLGPLGGLLVPNKPYPVKLKAVLPGLVATADGTVTAAKSGEPVVALQMTADATELSDVAKLFGYALPSLGAARVALTATGPADAPSLDNIDAALGRRDAVALTAKGQVRSPLTAQGVDLLLFVEGENLAGFNKALGVALPPLGAVKASAHLTDGEGGWHLGDFKATVGHSDLTADALVKISGPRPFIEAHLTSSAIDLGEWTKGAAAKPSLGSGRLFSDEPLPVQLLPLVDADMTWKIDRLVSEGLTAQQVALALTLKDGKLSLAPSVGSVAGGKADATLTVDAAPKPPNLSLAFDADKVDVGTLLKALGVTDAIDGARTSLQIDVKGSGNSVRALMARLNGETLLVTDKGTLDDAYADALALDLIRQLAPWTQEKNTGMHCLVSRFSIADGMARSEGLLFDTDYMTVSGQGSVNLASEVLDFTVTPKPKDASQLSLAVPLDVSGTLGHPMVTPNRGAIVKGLASVVGAVALGPVGALVPLVGSGNDEDNPCLAALKKPMPAKKGSKGPL